MAAYAIQFRRGTTTEHSSFTGLLGEVTVDTTKKSLVVHDGSTAGGFALALDGAATSTTTGTFSSNVTVGGTLAVTSTSTMGGDLTMTGDILPSANITYDLGSSTMMWKDIYVGPGSLYVNGKKVIEDDSGAINITTDINEDLKLTTTGTGTLKLISGNGINLTGELGAVSGDLQIGNHMDMNSYLIKEVATPVSTTDAANKAYVDSAASSAVTGGSNAVSGTTGAFSSNVTVGGNLTVSGTTTTINTAQINIADNIIVLNSDATGSASVNAGFEIERGDDANKQLLWNETSDRWSLNSEDIDAANFIGGLTGNVSGNVTGNITGDVTGNVTGNVTGDVTGNVTGNTSGSAGTVTSIAGHLLDEDNMGSDSATKVPSQQSVKAYVTSQIATKDNTDEMTEGSTNLYFTDARADARITAASTTDLSEGTNLYYTDARADARITAANTADLTEGTNLYYTDARARAAISATGSLAYNSTTGVMSFTMNDETVQDIVGPMFTSNTETGITVTYDDADGTIDLVVNQSHFHSAVQTVTAAEETDNSTSTTDYTFSDLTNAKHYVVFLNRTMLRPAEYSVSGSTLTIVSGIIALDDELEVTGFTNT